jgi:hypothetical protein
MTTDYENDGAKRIDPEEIQNAAEAFVRNESNLVMLRNTNDYKYAPFILI